MKTLRSALRQYIALRRALGTKLQEPAATLERFLDFLECEKAEFITSEPALRWAMQPQGRKPIMLGSLLVEGSKLARSTPGHVIVG